MLSTAIKRAVQQPLPRFGRERTILPLGQILLREALDRVIELSTATNKPDEVKKWQAERAKYPKAGPIPRVKK
jgi:hypothetical protein